MGRRLVAIDIETYDPNLSTLGDGACRNDGKILVIGTYDGEHAKAYIPFEKDWQEFVDMLCDIDVDKVFHNGIYDLSWLVCNLNLEAAGLLHDTMTRMVYIDEYADLDLDSCCKYFKLPGKNKAETIEAWFEQNRALIIPYLKAEGIAAKKNDSLWKHALFLWDSFKEFRDKMIEYNLQDCIATWNLYQAQEAKLSKVYDAYMVDVKLTPLIIKMKKTGVRIDIPAMQKLSNTITEDLYTKAQLLENTYGIDIDMIASSKKLGARLNEMGIHSPVLTETGNESWGADAMARLMHNPCIPLITEIKGYKKLLDTYMHGGLADAILADNRIHCTFSPNKREDGGTVTGRFACLATGTQIFTIEYGYIPIEKVSAGLHVITHTGKIAEVKQRICNGVRPVYLYGNLICTKDHLIWNGKIFKEARYVSIKDVPQERGVMPKNLRRVLIREQTKHRRFGCEVQDYCSQYTRSFETILNSGAAPYVAWFKSEQSREFRIKCYAWKMWRAASQLQRCNIGRSWQSNDNAQWSLYNVLQESYGRCYWDRPGRFTTRTRSTSYRRKQNEQRFKQSGFMQRRSTRTFAQEIAEQAEGYFMGNVLVWDLEIAHADHSFLANGYFVHNCSKPNLQQIPARDKPVGHSYGQDMRAMFLPEEGCMMAALDYSQIEYLLLAHFAQGQQADWFQDQARAGVDFHTVAMQATGIPSRQVVKTFNYGVIYGMGWQTAMEKNYVLFEKLAAEQGTDIETFTRQTYDNYHAKLPVIRETMKVVQNVTQQQGYIMTIGGRYQHKPKPQFDPATGKMNTFLYKMLNKLIQGSAADILKFALLEAYQAGVFDILTMHLTVHDENVVSVPFNKIGTEAVTELKRIMDMSFHSKLNVPMKAACELGPNWGYWSGDIYAEMLKGNFDPAFFNKDYRETH